MADRGALYIFLINFWKTCSLIKICILSSNVLITEFLITFFAPHLKVGIYYFIHVGLSD